MSRDTDVDIVRRSCLILDLISTCSRHQADGTYYVAVCHTNHGEIPGKAKGQYAWFPYGGKETRTENFSYVIVKRKSAV